MLFHFLFIYKSLIKKSLFIYKALTSLFIYKSLKCLFISYISNISGKKPFDYDIYDDTIIVYIHSTGYDGVFMELGIYFLKPYCQFIKTPPGTVPFGFVLLYSPFLTIVNNGITSLLRISHRLK